jgi:hypothetical protein
LRVEHPARQFPAIEAAVVDGGEERPGDERGATGFESSCPGTLPLDCHGLARGVRFVRMRVIGKAAGQRFILLE